MLYRTRLSPPFFVTLLAGLLSLQGCAQMSPSGVTRAVRIASASTSQTLCTAAFVSGLSTSEAYREEIRPAAGFGLIDWALHYEVDRDRKQVTATVFGTARRRAVYREGLGCVVDFGALPETTWVRPAVAGDFVDPFPSLASPQVVKTADPRIAAAIEAAFVEHDISAERPQKRNTQAVVVVHRGQLIAERYAPGVQPDTPLQGHSISKSLTHALYGRLVATGRLDPDQPVPVKAWRQPGDGRAAVTANQLLAMSSGLPWDEYAGGWDESTRMWFVEADPFFYASSVPLRAAPLSQWNYSNLGYAVLSRVLRDTLAPVPGPGAARAVLDFAHRELFAPLGMRTAVLTFDTTETPSGSNMFLASARDWARFGLLYLHEGHAGKEQLLSPDWVKAARTPTLDAGYGRGFWLNNIQTAHPLPGHWGMKGAPADAYFARGYLGQFIVIVPSADLVVVRLGISYRPGGDIETVGKMVGNLAALLSPR